MNWSAWPGLPARVIGLALAGCGPDIGEQSGTPAPAAVPFADFLEQSYRELLQRSPVTMDTRGDYSANDRWDDISDTAAKETGAILQRQLESLQKYDREQQ